MATPKIQKFLRKTPRYILRPEDSRLIRYLVRGRHRREVINTKITDISSRGLAFTTSAFTAPHVGEIIAMDFNVPQSEKIAAHGKVVRIEHYSDQANDNLAMVKVGVEFMELPPRYRELLEKKVAKAIDDSQAKIIAKELAKRFDAWLGNILLYGKYTLQVALVFFAIVGFIKFLHFVESRQPVSGPMFGKQISDWLDNGQQAKPAAPSDRK